MADIPSLIRVERRETDMVLAYNDGSEFTVDYRALRLRCPCANCDPRRESEARMVEFEKEVSLQRNEKPSVEKVGHFGLQFSWDDRGCSSGIFGFDLLYNIAKEYSNSN